MNTKNYRWIAFILSIALIFSSFGGAGYAEESISTLGQQAPPAAESLTLIQEIYPTAIVTTEAITFYASSGLLELAGISANAKTLAQFAWIGTQTEPHFYVAISTAVDPLSKMVTDIKFNGDTYDVNDMEGVWWLNSPNTPLYVEGDTIIDGQPGLVTTYANKASETYNWLVFDLGYVGDITGTFQLEINAGPGGYSVLGANAYLSLIHI